MSKTSWTINPESAPLWNELMSVFLMGSSSLYYFVWGTGDHDYFQWVMHISAWGQTQLFWLYDLFTDSANSRMNYYLSFELTNVIPAIG